VVSGSADSEDLSLRVELQLAAALVLQIAASLTNLTIFAGSAARCCRKPRVSFLQQQRWLWYGGMHLSFSLSIVVKP